MDIGANIAALPLLHTWRGDRRAFLTWAGAGLTTALLGNACRATVQAVPGARDGVIYRDLSGATMAGWKLALGDGIYALPGEAAVSLLDIETRHDETVSEVRANIQKRQIMAHNITYRRERDDRALDFVHIFTGEFRLPYLPSIENVDENAQTVEAGLFVWDGLETRLDYGAAFQWGLNPYNEGQFGEVRASMEGVSAAAWEPVGWLEPDLNWHTFTLAVDYPNERTLLQLDGVTFTSYFVGFAKQWPAAISAGVQVEAISIYPGDATHGALHRVEFRNWRWQWIASTESKLYLPLVAA